MRTIGLILLCLCSAYGVLQDAPYFPIRQNEGDPGIRKFEAERYGKALGRMNEPRLPDVAKEPKAVVYRFTILPAWGNPIAVRAQWEAGAFSLSSRRLDGQGGYDPGKLVEQKEVKLTADDSKTLESLIAALGLFQMPTEDDTNGRDGDEWILEGVAEGRYHVVARWCAGSHEPKKRGLEPFLALCSFLIDKSTLSERPRNRGHELLPPKECREAQPESPLQQAGRAPDR